MLGVAAALRRGFFTRRNCAHYGNATRHGEIAVALCEKIPAETAGGKEMKTPREILLERHLTAAPKLDAIRQSAVAAVCDRRISTDRAHERRSQTAVTMILETFWRELIWPSRRIWAGLAATWILVF